MVAAAVSRLDEAGVAGLAEAVSESSAEPSRSEFFGRRVTLLGRGPLPDGRKVRFWIDVGLDHVVPLCCASVAAGDDASADADAKAQVNRFSAPFVGDGARPREM